MSLNSKQPKNILGKKEGIANPKLKAILDKFVLLIIELFSCEENGEDGPYFGIEYLDDQKKTEDESVEILYIQYTDETDNGPSTVEKNIVSNVLKSHESKRDINIKSKVLRGDLKKAKSISY